MSEKKSKKGNVSRDRGNDTNDIDVSGVVGGGDVDEEEGNDDEDDDDICLVRVVNAIAVSKFCSDAVTQ